MDFESAVKYLDSFISYERTHDFDYNEETFDLKRVKKLFAELKIDLKKLKFIHVGGSKGKGSVCTMLTDYLNLTGHRAGIFTSPHMLNVRERIMVGGKMISQRDFARLAGDLKKHIDSEGGVNLGKGTYFEFLFALAVKYFIEKEVEIAVIEVGLGGRLDATNIITPEISVITSIEKEHTNILGNTIAEIAREKLGIMKPKVNMVLGFLDERTKKTVFQNLNNRKKVFFVQEEADINVRTDLSESKSCIGEIVFDMKIGGDDLNDLRFLFGSGVQVKNAALSYFVLKRLFGKVDLKAFKKVLHDFRVIGRFDVREINGKKVVFDIAHTKLSIVNLMQSLNSSFTCNDFVFLVSIMKDKKVKEILKNIGEFASEVIFTFSHKERSFKAEELKKIFEKVCKDNDYCCGSLAIEDTNAAYKKFLSKIKKDQVGVITGSHFLVGEILKTLQA